MPSGKMAVIGHVYPAWLVANDPWPPPERSRWEWGPATIPKTKTVGGEVMPRRDIERAAVCRIDF